MTIHDNAEAARRAVYDQAFEALNDELADLTEDINSLVSGNTALQALVDGLEAELDAAASANAALQGQVGGLEAEVSSLNSEQEEILGELQIYMTELVNSRAEIQTLTEKVSALEARIRDLTTPVEPPVTGDPQAGMKPRSYATKEEAIAGLGLPTDANYVLWDNTWPNNLETVFATKLRDNDVLVLPERAEPYYIDSSKGFLAAGVKDMEYISDADFATRGYTEKVVSGLAPVDSSSNRLWFSMARARRGVLGLGPGAVIKPSNSGYKGQRQPKNNMIITYTNGTKGTMVGVQQKLLEAANSNAIFANFKLEGQDLGTIAYSAIGLAKGTTVIRRLWVDRAWNGFAGIPNGESGGLSLGVGYDIDGVLLSTDEAFSSSPIMFNRSTGGKMKNVFVGQHRIGMVTQWRSTGTHVWENVTTNGGTVGLNLEEEGAGFVLRWTGGALNCSSQGQAKHLNINPSGGSQVVTLTDVAISGYYGAETNKGKIMGHVYGTANTQRKADVTWNKGEIMYLPSNLWI